MSFLWLFFFSVEFGNTSNISVYQPLPSPRLPGCQKSLVFSQLSFYLNSVKCQGLNPNSFLPHSLHQQLLTDISLRSTAPGVHPHHLCLKHCHLLTGLDPCKRLQHAFSASTLASSYKSNSTQATCCVILLTYRLGHVTPLHKMLQFHLTTFENFQLRTLFSASPSNFISSHSPLNCSQWIQLHYSVLDLNRLVLAGILFSLNFWRLATSWPSDTSSNVISSESSFQALINLN